MDIKLIQRLESSSRVPPAKVEKSQCLQLVTRNIYKMTSNDMSCQKNKDPSHPHLPHIPRPDDKPQKTMLTH